jgi:hypothetical protein
VERVVNFGNLFLTTCTHKFIFLNREMAVSSVCSVSHRVTVSHWVHQEVAGSDGMSKGCGS